MKVVVKTEACVGHGRCAAIGPEVFDLDELGYVVQTTFEVVPGLEEAADRGANACPERAISILRD